jgi:hypothetical protein
MQSENEMASQAQPVQPSTGVNDDPKSNPQGNAIKDPSQWVTKDEPMTGAQASYLKTLCEEANENFDASLTKANASEMIDRLQSKTGRGKDN